MARSDYDESPRSSRPRRKHSHHVPPPAPEVPTADGPESPRRRRRSEREWDGDRSRPRDGDWDRWQEEDVLLRTPESRTSSSSYHPSHGHYRDAGSRRDRSTTSTHSVASSMTSVPTPHPPRSSMTRLSNPPAAYRRPSVPMRDVASAGYEEDVSRGSRRSHSQARSMRAVPSVPASPRTSRTLRSASVSSYNSEHDDGSEEPYDVQDDMRDVPAYRETRLVRVVREEVSRSRSRAGTGASSYRPSRRGGSIRPRDDDYDETDSRHAPSLDDMPSVRMPSRPVSRSRSRPASARHIPDPESDHEHDADSDEPPPRRREDRFERRDGRKHRQNSRASRDHVRSRSENPSRRSPPSKRYVLPGALLGIHPGSSRRVRSSKLYYESEAPAAPKQDRRHPPSSSFRRPTTVIGSGSVDAPQPHHSVSSSTRRSSTFFGSLFGSSLPGHSHRHAPEKPVKL